MLAETTTFWNMELIFVRQGAQRVNTKMSVAIAVSFVITIVKLARSPQPPAFLAVLAALAHLCIYTNLDVC